MTPVSLPPAAHVAQPVASDAQRWSTYVVRPGDTLWDLADRFDTTVSAIVAYNGLTSAGVSLHVGDRLALPQGGSASSTPGTGAAHDATASQGATSGSSYLVRSGDSLWDIANAAGVDVDALMAANGLSATSTILPGQRLTIPGGASGSAATAGQASQGSSYGTYVVRPGDTLWDIAGRLGVDVQELVSANGLSTSSTILPGQRLTAPGGQAAARAATKAARTSAADTGAISVTVRPGDTLWDIASRYGVSVTSLAKANGLALGDLLMAGRTLTVKGSVASSAADPTTASSLSSSAAANLGYLNSVGTPARTQIRSMIVATAQAHGVDPRLALAIAWQESRWSMNAVSEVNAIGVMQCLPSTADWVSQLVGRDLNLLDTQDNITCGVVLLRSLTRATSSESEAIAAYYQGLTSVRTIGLYDDTRDYVASVLAYKNQM